MLATFKGLCAAAAATICLSGAALANTVNWGALGGLNDFTSDEVTFTPFFADTIVSVTGQGNLGTNNGALYQPIMTLDLRIDSVWTSVFTLQTSGTAFISSEIANLSFAYGSVSGIRASATGADPNRLPFNNWALGQGFTPQVFTFDALNPPPPNAVPLPASLPLLVAGLLGFGVLHRRRAAQG